MEKSNNKEKHNKDSNKKLKNNSLINSEEYNQIFDKNKVIMEFGEKIYNIYGEIKNATSEYCEKLNQITKQLNPDTQNNIGILQKIINDILMNSTNAIDKAINIFEQGKSRDINFDFFEEYKNKIDKFKKEYQEKLEVFNTTKKGYIEEMDKYEAYLVNSELEKTNNTEKDNKKKDKKKDKNNSLNDNHIKACEQQEKYINAKNDLKISLQKIIFYINTERKLIFQSLNQNCEAFFKSIKYYLANLKKIIEEEKNFYKENPINNDEDLINEEDMINNILKDEFYSFKFLTYNKNNDKYENEEEDSKNKKKKKDNLNFDNLLEQLKIDNKIRIVKELEHHKIKFNEDNSNKISVLENKLIIESLTDLILNNPVKFKDDNKNNLISLLKSNKDNQNSFMTYLNNYRAKGLFIQKKITITILCDLFEIIIEMAVKNNDYKIIQYAIILSSTYCYVDETKINKDKNNCETDDNDVKIYMTHYLKKSKIFKEKSFWLNYMKGLINDELEKISQRKENAFNQKQKDFAIYSSVFALIKNMIDFDLDFNFINDELTDIFALYKFKDTEKLDIINYLIAETQRIGKNNNKEK